MSSNSKTTFEYNGVTYKSMAECLRAIHVPSQSIFHLMRKKGCSAQVAIDVWKKANYRRLHGFLPIKEIAKRYGIPYNTFRCYYKQDVEGYIASRVEQRFILPDKLSWVESDWFPVDNKEYPMSSLDIKPECYSDKDGNLLIEFSNIDGIPFRVQYQKPGFWLLQAGPCPVMSAFDIMAANRDLWYGSWSSDDEGDFYLRCAQVARKTSWSDIIKLISVMTRLCASAMGHNNV